MNTNLSTAVASAQDIRDIRPPFDIFNPWVLFWLGLGLLVIAALVTAAVVYFLKKRCRVPSAPPVPAHVRARQKLEEALALISQPKAFCTMVSDTIRYYLEERFDFHAPERTTEEFLHELSGTNLLAPDQKSSLGEFLGSCDLVKFARYEPGETELHDLHNSALRLVEETEPVELNVQSESHENRNESLVVSAKT